MESNTASNNLEKYLSTLDELSMEEANEQRKQDLRRELSLVKAEVIPEITELLTGVLQVDRLGNLSPTRTLDDLQSELLSALSTSMLDFDPDTRTAVLSKLTEKKEGSSSAEHEKSKAIHDRDSLVQYMILAPEGAGIARKIEVDNIPEDVVSGALMELAEVDKEKAQYALQLLAEKRIISLTAGALSIGNEGILHLLKPVQAAGLVMKQLLHDMGKFSKKAILETHKVQFTVREKDGTTRTVKKKMSAGEKGEVFAIEEDHEDPDLQAIFKDLSAINAPVLLLALSKREDFVKVLAYMEAEALDLILYSTNYSVEEMSKIKATAQKEHPHVGDIHAAEEAQKELQDMLFPQSSLWDDISDEIDTMVAEEKERKQDMAEQHRERAAKILKVAEEPEEEQDVPKISEKDILGDLF
jgi:hypothetical protein